MEYVFKFCQKCDKKRKHEYNTEIEYYDSLEHDDYCYSTSQLIDFMNGEFSDCQKSFKNERFKCLKCKSVEVRGYVDPNSERAVLDSALRLLVERFIKTEDCEALNKGLGKIIKKHDFNTNSDLWFLDLVMGEVFAEYNKSDPAFFENAHKYILGQMKKVEIE